MSCEDAFFEAIRDDPPDDTPRLVYADWLEENGDPERAEFIRLQCELARMDPDDPGRPALEQRERALLAAHEAEWLGPLHPHLLEWSFERGFVGRLRFGSVGGLAASEGLLGRSPGARVACWAPRQEVAYLARSPALARVGTLTLETPTDPGLAGHLEEVIRSPHALGLRGLALTGRAIHNAFAELLADTPTLASLRSLRLGGTAVSTKGLTRLLLGRHWTALRELWLSGDRLGEGDLPRLTASRHAGRWVGLGWFARAVSGADLASLAACPNLRSLEVGPLTGPVGRFPSPPSLTELSLPERAELPLLRSLAGWDRLASLRKLDLDLAPDGSREDVAAVSDLLGGLAGPVAHLTLAPRTLGAHLAFSRDARHLEKVVGLRLTWHLDRGHLKALADCPGWTGLRSLSLTCSQVADQALAGLLASPALARVKALEVGALGLGPASAAALGPSLRELVLSANQVSPGFVEGLAGWPGLARLSLLELPNPGDETLRPLAESLYLAPPTRLVLRGRPHSSPLHDAFRRRLGRRFATR
jgi:uncharacterized protein (TIGR02996 family)